MSSWAIPLGRAFDRSSASLALIVNNLDILFDTVKHAIIDFKHVIDWYAVSDDSYQSSQTPKTSRHVMLGRIEAMHGGALTRSDNI